MKKILLFALPIMVMCAVSCEKEKEEVWTDDSPIIQFKDQNFLERLLNCPTDYYLDDSIDRNADGQISQKEASVVKRLNVATSSDTNYIRYIDEIKYFTALTELNCDLNRITSLDLSNNTALTRLSCMDNQLTSLDVRNNTALTSLTCSYNQLTSLDVSNNTALEYLSCYENQLIYLDVRNNTALTSLRCGDNQLTSLYLSNNTALWTLECYDSQLTSLDLSNNTALQHLTCSENPLTKIILNRNHMIESYDIQNIIEEYGDIIEYVD